MSATDETETITHAVARLEALGAELDRAGWRTRLVAEPGRVPCLHVQNPQPGATALAEDIYCAPRRCVDVLVELGRAHLRRGRRSRSDCGQGSAGRGAGVRTRRHPVTGIAAELTPSASPPRTFLRLQAHDAIA